MIVDSSALIAILKREPEQAAFSAILQTEQSLSISAATYLETSIVVDGRRQPIISRKLDDLIERAGIVIEPVTVEQVKIAREAYRAYGRGSGHPANLNFGDCFSYALAYVKREPMLYKGDDFVHTDIQSA
jgi:ribonuclease VapC